MSDVDWSISGQYAENCSCEYMCPCFFTNPTALSRPPVPQIGNRCIAVICLHIETGHFGTVKPDDLSFIVGVEGYLSRVNHGEPFYLDNVGHPVNRRLALGIATGSHAHLPGIDWDDDTKTNDGHFASFNWNGSARPVAYKFDRNAAL